MICTRCGSANARPVELFHVRKQEVTSKSGLCELCLNAVMGIAGELDKEFETLIASGTPREVANQIMAERFEAAVGWRPSDN